MAPKLDQIHSTSFWKLSHAIQCKNVSGYNHSYKLGKVCHMVLVNFDCGNVIFFLRWCVSQLFFCPLVSWFFAEFTSAERELFVPLENAWYSLNIYNYSILCWAGQNSGGYQRSSHPSWNSAWGYNKDAVHGSSAYKKALCTRRSLLLCKYSDPERYQVCLSLHLY